jgi:hypothetical protein
MSDPNDSLYLHASRASIRRLVEEAWHDSAQCTADRLITAIEKRLIIVSRDAGPGPFHVGTWTHIFDEQGKQVERTCEIALAENGRRVVAMTIVRDNKQQDAVRAEMDDVSESLDQNGVGGSPEDWDLVEEHDLPSWAADQVVDRATGLLS